MSKPAAGPAPLTARGSLVSESPRSDLTGPVDSGGSADSGERMRFMPLDGFRGVEVCVGENVAAAPPRSLLYDDAEVRLITRGCVQVACNGERSRVAQGGVLWIPQQQLHEWTAASAGSYSFLALQVTREHLNGVQVTELATGTLAPDDFKARAPLADRTVVAMLSWATGLQPRVRSRSASSVPPIDRAVDYLRHHFAEKIGLDELALAAGLSKFHFLRLFAATLGTTPHRYQMLLRIARARSLLRTNAQLAEVALHTGFFDQSHFTRCFHEIVGVTPGRYLLDMTAPPPTRH
jgi:AraC-like DNA-binding protein